MKITIHAVHSLVSDAVFNKESKVAIHKSIIVYITYAYDLYKFEIEVYGRRSSALNIESTGDFLYIHADKIHECITKKLKIIYGEIEDLL